ncbi:MAG TPA: hypothetical protein VFP27_01375, partial [Mycobacterium sp.]|nr:hypothetical protein [Mycobacterium sp.]
EGAQAVTSARVSGALWDDIDRWTLASGRDYPICMRGRPHGVLAARPHAWLTSGDEVIVPGYVCVVRPRFAPVRRPGQDDDHGGHGYRRIDRRHRTRGGPGC